VLAFSHLEELQLLGLLLAVGVLLSLAPTLRIPYPILLVLGGLALGFVPGLPDLTLAPELVLVAILPPLLYYAAFSTSLRDLRANTRPIALLSIGLVIVTTVAVAVVGTTRSRACRGRRRSSSARSSRRRIRSPPRQWRTPGRSPTVDRDHRGREPRQRRERARALQVRRHRGRDRLVLDLERRVSLVVNVAGGLAIGLAVGYAVRQVRKRLDYPPGRSRWRF
jgi:hypothetical protein